MIGDLSKRQGGSFGGGSSHGSHQSGLDVDISFDFATPKKSFFELSHPQDVYLVDTHNRVTKNFDKRRVALIYLAASDSRVERIFVAPGIKKHYVRSMKVTIRAGCKIASMVWSPWSYACKTCLPIRQSFVCKSG